MKRLVFLFALLSCLSLGAQEQKDWSVEIGAKAFASIYHGCYDITVGARYKQFVFGLESGYGTFYVDAAPGHIGFLPVYGFARFYAPVTESGWLQLFGEVTAGGYYEYCFRGVEENPHWVIPRLSVSAGLAFRIAKVCYITLAPTAEIVRGSTPSVLPGASLGLSFNIL